jgi:mycothiol synthase
MIRRTETRADLEANAACWCAVWPEDAVSADFMLERLAREPERLYIGAFDSDRVVGTGFVGRSSRPGCRPIAVTVLPERRGRGLGSKLFERCLAHVRSLGAATAIGTVSEEDTASVEFVTRRGFEVTDRVVSLVLDLNPAPSALPPPEGVEIVELDPSRHEEAYAVFCAGIADMPAATPLEPGSFAHWAAEVERHPLTLVALEAGRIVGYADLELRNEAAGVVGNDLTTVVRDHRGRGVAQALKRAQAAWAAAHGFRQVTTATHAANEPMRRVNEKLGYRPGPALLDVARSLE